MLNYFKKIFILAAKIIDFNKSLVKLLYNEIQLEGAMKKSLTKEQFNIAINNININDKTKYIAYQVLVEGVKQIDLVNRLNLTKGNISQAVNKVFNAYNNSDEVPAGYERVTVVLPEHKAFIVKKWEKNKR